MPLMNINSDWMSNTSSGLCIILFILYLCRSFNSLLGVLMVLVNIQCNFHCKQGISKHTLVFTVCKVSVNIQASLHCKHGSLSYYNILWYMKHSFNHRVVTMVAENLKRQWLCIVYFANCIRQPERKLPRPSTMSGKHWITKERNAGTTE